MRYALPLLALSLAACGGGTPANPTNAAAAPNGLTDVQQSIVDMPEAARHGVFLRAIRDARQDCQGVTASERRDAATAGADPTWTATCQGGATYGVTVTRDGTALVVTG